MAISKEMPSRNKSRQNSPKDLACGKARWWTITRTIINDARIYETTSIIHIFSCLSSRWVLVGGVKDWEFEDLLHTGKVTAGSPKNHQIEKENHMDHPPPWLWVPNVNSPGSIHSEDSILNIHRWNLDLLPFHPNSKWIWNQNPLLKPPWKGSVCQAICQIILVSSMELSSDS